MSIFASILRAVYRLSGVKKSFTLPENELRKEIEKQNRHRGVFTPTDHKAYYETITVNGFPCLIVRENPNPSKRAILYFFGGGMVIGPDKGDLPVMRKLCRETGCDVWFPFYPLCMEHCITETYEMVMNATAECSNCTAVEMSAPVAFPPAAHWLWESQRTIMRSRSHCRSHGISLPYHPAKCHGTMAKNRG